jgi:hypothetical protein
MHHAGLTLEQLEVIEEFMAAMADALAAHRRELRR